MRIVLMRHGHAERTGSDPALSEHGRTAVSVTAERIVCACSPQRVVHSPLRRAVQTAALVIAACGDAQRTESAHLLPSAAPDVIGTQLIRWGEDVDTLLVIAHLPLLPRLSHWLCGRLLAFEPADAWCLEAETEVAWQGTFDIVSVPE